LFGHSGYGTEGSNADKFDETAELEQFTAQQLPTSGETDLANQLSAELYQPLTVIETVGDYSLVKPKFDSCSVENTRNSS
jgi:hypothetical protein